MNHWKPAGLSVGILIKIPPRLQRSILRGTYYMYDVKKKWPGRKAPDFEESNYRIL